MIFKVVIRNIIKRPFLNLVKVLGLGLALSGILFIALFLKNELTYDAHHHNPEQVYRLTTTDPNFLAGKHFARISNPNYLEDLKQRSPELTDYVRLKPVRGGLIRYNEMFYHVNQGFECDSTFFNFFNVELSTGNKLNVLNSPGSMVITESFGKRVFGKANPIGEILTIPSGQYYGADQNFTVKGIMNDFPSNGHFHPDFITTASHPEYFAWGWAWTYLRLEKNSNPEKVSTELESYFAERAQIDIKDLKTKAHLQPMLDIHLKSNKFREIETNGNLTNIYVLIIAGIVLILIAMSNYANMNIGMAGFSAKYLFVNKLLGSSKKSIINYFLLESLVVVGISILLTFLISLPINSLVVRHYGLDLFSNNARFVFIGILTFALLGILFGMLPILKSVFRFINTKNSINDTKLERAGVSRFLIATQYAFSIALIISVFVITKQNNYAINSGIGNQNDNVIVMERVHANVQQKFEVFKEELLKYNSIQSVSAMMEPPGGEANDMFPFEMEGYVSQKESDDEDRIGVFPCDYSFASLFNLEFLDGNNFTKENTEVEGSGEYIINEAAMHRLNHTNPNDIVGKSFKLVFMNPGIEIPQGRIIGVVKDFHLSSLKNTVEPMVMFKRDKLWLLNFAVSHQPGMRETAINDMNTVWTKLFPEYPFKYEHVSAMYQKVYKTELLQAKLLSVFTIVALFICAMGLLGLALIITQQRVKEIGVRKVNGAKVSEILALLNKDFVLWVMVAFVVACPAAWFAMNKWLDGFAYKTEMNWWIFALAGFIALAIALLTVSIQSWKAATRNPIEALRYE